MVANWSLCDVTVAFSSMTFAPGCMKMGRAGKLKCGVQTYLCVRALQSQIAWTYIWPLMKEMKVDKETYVIIM